MNRQTMEAKVALPSAVSTPCVKPPGPAIKLTMNKQTAPKEQPKEMSPPTADEPGSELLGSLTTQQQQRTSARVIKKLKLEPLADKKKRPDGVADDIPECDTPSKIPEELKFPTVKQRMPKALWSADEKSLFFEALNEYGKDFDAITAYICAKMKKKGIPDNLKTKTQVSHFYYRTWHKLSKHVHFDENVKKVAQELYSLINYGELRKKLVSVNEKTCGRLGEMVLCGSIMVRARGRNLRVRTPMCRALRRLNQITERLCGSRVCARAVVSLRARDAAAWARVQAAAHNPRAAVALPPRARLRALLAALATRWRVHPGYKHKLSEEAPQVRRDDGDHLNLETDRLIVKEQKVPKKLSLHVGPRPGAELHLPALSPSAQLSSQKICLSSYLERMAQRRDNTGAKIRTPKRQRKDSATEKDKEDQKKMKLDEETSKLIHIEETAIDGIELMATYKSNQEDERPSTEDEKEMKEDVDQRAVGDEETEKDDTGRDKEEGKAREDGGKEREEGGRDREMSEREKDSFSEMEDDEKYTKSDTDNESDHGKGKERKFKNLKVKFRIRPKKRGGSIYTLVMEDKEDKEEKEEKPDVDVELALRQIRKGWSWHDAGDLTIGDLYLMFGSRSKLELDYWWAEPTPPLPQPQDLHPDPLVKLEKTDKTEKTPDKGAESSVEDDKGARESDQDIFSPKNTFSQDSNDGSGDERKSEQLMSPEHKSSSTLKLVSKLVNRPQPPAPPASNTGFNLLSDRLKRLLSLVGNPHVPNSKRCGCGHECGARQVRPPAAPPPPPARDLGLFRHPPPIAPRLDNEAMPATLDLGGVPRCRRGRPRVPDRRVVVQRLLPLLPKLPPPTPLIPVKIPNSPPSLPRILPKPPPTSTSDLSMFYVLSESNGQFFFHDGDRRIPITQPASNGDDLKVTDEEASGAAEVAVEVAVDAAVDGASVAGVEGEPASAVDKPNGPDIGNFLPSDSMSLSPSRLLRDAEGWLEGSVQDFSLSSFLGHLEGRAQPDLAVDSHLQSLMAESSVDYVAKFADLAAEVTDEVDPPPSSDDLT